MGTPVVLEPRYPQSASARPGPRPSSTTACPTPTCGSSAVKPLVPASSACTDGATTPASTAPRDTLFLRRAHPIGQERQHLELLTEAQQPGDLPPWPLGRRPTPPARRLMHATRTPGAAPA